MYGYGHLQNLYHMSDFANALKTGSAAVSAAAPVAGQIWNTVDHKSYEKHHGDKLMNDIGTGSQAVGAFGNAFDMKDPTNFQSGLDATANIVN